MGRGAAAAARRATGRALRRRAGTRARQERRGLTLVGEGRLDEGGARGPIATVFVSDPTAEAERVARELRAAGYAVVDVPLSMLVARVAVQHPRIILVDA